MVGKRFGRLVVISRDNEPKNKRDTYWICRCDCGNIKSVTKGHLKGGSVRSCGCLRKEIAANRFRQAAKGNIKHGEAKTRLYNIWHAMKQRCENRNDSHYKWYGKKGISVCKDWKEYADFAKWAYAAGYSDDLTIDRIDSKGNYCPENCRWIPAAENTRRAAKERWENAKSSMPD